MTYWNNKDYGDIGQIVQCWESHPVYEIDGLPITGGSCTRCYPKDVDVFIGLDWSMTSGGRSYPWEEGTDVLFKITDMSVPTSVYDFKKLIEYASNAMREGKTVFVGCIGGHGRTGLFLAALTTHMTGEKDSITVVRKNYCKKAVESTKQVNWLHQHFGIKKVANSKTLTPALVKYDKKGNLKSTSKKSDPVAIGTLGITESPKTKYHCVSGKSIFVNK